LTEYNLLRPDIHLRHTIVQSSYQKVLFHYAILGMMLVKFYRGLTCDSCMCQKYHFTNSYMT